jgi:uncharacterized membrane protein
MTWHYAVGAEQRGPIDDAELDRLVASGEITPDTLVWRAGMAGWQPLREARTGQIVSQAIAPVAAAPAPAAVPRPSIDPEAASARIAAEGRRVAVFDSLRRGWDLVFAEPGQSIGISALVILMMIGAGFVPCVGSIVQLVATGPLIAGWYLYFLKRIRGQHTEWGDAIAAFSSPMLTQLILEHIVSTVVAVFVMVPMLIVFFVSILGAAAAAAADERMAPLVILGLVALFLVTFAVMLYMSISWMFALPLIIDKQIDFWPAMKLSWRVTSRQFFPLLGLLLLCALVYFAGILALCVGLFVALPVCVAALAYTYEDLFGERDSLVA